MTPEEVFEFNKRCAEFIGLRFDGVMYRNTYEIMSFFPHLDHSRYPNELEFHTDWNWIMEIVEKIQTLDKRGGIVMIQQGRCMITSRMFGDHSVYADISLYFKKGVKGQKEAVVQAINKFLIWYNENKN